MIQHGGSDPRSGDPFLAIRHYTILTRMRPLVASLPMGSTFVEALHVFPSYYKSALKMKQQLLLSLPATFGIRVPPVAGAWYKHA